MWERLQSNQNIREAVSGLASTRTQKGREYAMLAAMRMVWEEGMKMGARIAAEVLP